MLEPRGSAQEIQKAGGMAAWLAKEAKRPSKAPSSLDKSLDKKPITRRPQRKSAGQNKGQKVPEHEEQKRLFQVCKLHEKKYPGLELIYATPNGGQRHIAVAAKLKAEGVKAGVPDIFLPVARGNAHGLYIELKARGGRVSPAQYAMLNALARQGYACLVSYGWEEAWIEIEKYMQSETVQMWPVWAQATSGEGEE